MGNCLKSSTNDDISLIRNNDSNRESIDEPIQTYPETLQPVFFPSPSNPRTANLLTEDEQIKIAKRIGLIQHLPIGQYTDENFKSKKIPCECDICMNEFVVGDNIRYLPCMHQYHVQCIDSWLMRSLTCPSCCEPVDAGLLTTYETI